MQRQRRNGPHGAEGEKGRVDRDPGTHQCFDVFFEPIKRCWFGLQDEPKIGGDGSDTNGWHTEHQRFVDAQRFDEAGERGDREQRLQTQISPLAMAAMALSMLYAGPAVPREIYGEDGKSEHHPAEDPAYPWRIGEMRVRPLRIDQGADANADRGRPGCQHGPGEHPTPTAVQGAAFSAYDGNPERYEAEAAKENVQHDEGVKQADYRLGHPVHAANLTL